LEGFDNSILGDDLRIENEVIAVELKLHGLHVLARTRRMAAEHTRAEDRLTISV
jgi:hypothetical protein